MPHARLLRVSAAMAVVGLLASPLSVVADPLVTLRRPVRGTNGASLGA